jgi:membrane-associated phospholipid phosphatase
MVKPARTPSIDPPPGPRPGRAKTGLLNSGGLILCLLLVAALAKLCRGVWEKESWRLDSSLLLWLHGWANPTLDQLMLGLTRLGDPEVVLPVVLGSLGVFLWRRRRAEALMLLVSCGGALVLNQGMKLLFARARPVLWPPLIRETSYGFPSGHALGSLVLYGYLAVVLAHGYPRQAPWIHGIAIALILLIGVSRLYLGVHYPTDIVAGYAAGGLWLLLCLQALKRLRPRRSVAA